MSGSQRPARSRKTVPNGMKKIHIDEGVKISVNVALERFRYGDQKEMEFPSSLTSTERAFIHRTAQSLGYISRSKGKGPNRFLTLRKKSCTDKPRPSMPLPLSQNSIYSIRSLLQRFPVSNKERVDMQPNTRSGMSVSSESEGGCDRASGRLNNGIPTVPKRRSPSDLDTFRQSLPVHERQEEIIHVIRESRVVLVVGETGSGKTTQIPQFLLDDCSRKGEPCRIFCTQPRRLAAIAVAERVAAERGERVGQTVGYHIRLESRVSPKTLLTFCTSGVFLRTLMSGDASLTNVTHVIVDEVHERDGLTDFLLTKLRDVLLKIPTLKLILSSAALDVDLFLKYFGSCPIIHLKGRLFEVKEVFLEDILRLTGFNNKDMKKYKEETQRTEKKQKNLKEWCEAVESSCVEERRTSPVSVPAFLQDNKPMENDTEQLVPWLQKEMDSCITNIFLNEDQDAFIQLFNLILHENVNVDYRHSGTAACGLKMCLRSMRLTSMEQKSFDTLSHVSMLKTVWISKASALQRKGRAGRCRPGICFHLFSRLRFSNMLEFQVPQLLRMPLQELCLQTKLLAPSSCPVADFLSKAPQPPSAHAIRNAVQMLKTIDAMDQNEDLTDLGYHLADLPVEPHLGKMVLCAVVLKCLDPILTIACTLAYRDPFVLPAQGGQKKAAIECRKRFTANTFSDHMALLRAFQAWQKARSDGWERSFCEKNFLSQATMDMILGMRTQLLGQLRAIGFVRARGGSDIRDVNLNSENWAMVKAALVAGMYPNLVHVNQETSLPSSYREKKVHFHPSSILNQSQLKENGPSRSPHQALPTDWLIYDEMSRGHRMASVRCCSMVTPITVAVFGGCAKLPSSALQEPSAPRDSFQENSDSETEELSEFSLDDWLVFRLDSEAAGAVFELRQKWQNLFIKRIRCPSKPWTQQDEAIIRTLVSVLGAEEQGAGLQQPTGIGQRPRPITSEDDSQAFLKNPKSSPQPPSNTSNDRSCRMPASSSLLQMKALCLDEASLSMNPLSEDPPSSSNSSCSVSLDFSAPSSSGKISKPPSSQPAFPSVRHFIMKSSSLRNIEISQQKGIWSTTPSNEGKLAKAFLENNLIILIFSVQGSGHFQGYARMTSIISQESCQDWGFMGLGGVFSVEWIHRESVPFLCTQHILNTWNDNKKVQISRDGQELEPQAGSQLMSLWEGNSAAQ
ncbi:3'-5' RNA helicase YTHDC2 [Pseudochaenichthys georgianus]|uniref:3'-5' RNA helicase YTHDC2 n=1 Tax=Pseudochaenichthys georgianus TaxID=52239 RepID=UPI00146A2C71|nr:3'-5' RNA helicase YTHDC2 [Pseudochaenichthys georgianus]